MMDDSENDPTSETKPRAIPPGGFRPLTWSQIAAGIQAWLRRTFAAASLVSGLKSLAWVAPLSVLIWIYAEREQIADRVPIAFTVQVKSLDPSRVARIIDPADAKLRGDFSGPQGGMEQVRGKLEAGIPVTVELSDGELTPGSHPILSTRVNQDPMLVKNGISVSAPIPNEINIFVDKLEETTLDVQPPPDAKNIVGSPTFEPRKVKVVAPHTVLNSARARQADCLRRS